MLALVTHVVQWNSLHLTHQQVLLHYDVTNNHCPCILASITPGNYQTIMEKIKITTYPPKNVRCYGNPKG